MSKAKTQIIKLPKAFHIDDGKVGVCLSNNRPNVIEITPRKKMTTREFLESTPALSDDFVITRDNKPPREVDCTGW